jgi:hypothetical protein
VTSTRRPWLAVGALVAVLVASVAACATPAPSAQIVTFQVADGSRYKVLITDPDDLDTVQALADGEDAPSIPNGLIVHEPGVNTEWSWSLDPTDFAFVDVVDGLCDGVPQDIEDGTHSSDRFCPWSAIVVATEPAP